MAFGSYPAVQLYQRVTPADYCALASTGCRPGAVHPAVAGYARPGTVMDWTKACSLATGFGALVLAVATFTAVGSANRGMDPSERRVGEPAGEQRGIAHDLALRIIGRDPAEKHEQQPRGGAAHRDVALAVAALHHQPGSIAAPEPLACLVHAGVRAVDVQDRARG